MQSIAGERKSSSDDLTGQNKSKLKTLKTRRFGKTKRDTKLSQSASDITEEEGLGSAEDLCAGVLGSRALSHDSIFLAEQEAPSVEQPNILSKDSVQGRIKELQMKLRQQNLRLGPPPLVLPIKRPEDLGGTSDDDGLPHSPPKIFMGDKTQPGGAPYQFTAPPRLHSPLSLAGSEDDEQDSSQPWPHPLSPELKPPPACPVPPTSSAPLPAISPVTPASDFNTPAQVTSCLDNSAARHRMSIKPKHQRASAKNKRLSRTESRPRSESLHNLYQPLTENEEEAMPAVPGERTRSHSNQILMTDPGVSTAPTASPNLTPFKSGPTEALKCPNPSRPTLPCKPSPQEQPQPGLSVSSVPLTSQLSGAQQTQPPVSPAQDLRYTPQQQTLKQSLGGPQPPTPSQTEREVQSTDREQNSTQTTERIPKVDPVAEAQPTASLASLVALKTSSLIKKLEAHAGLQSATEPPAGREVPAQETPVSAEGSPRTGSRSFRFSVKAARELDGPRRGSVGFLGVVEQVEAAVGRREERKVGADGADASQRGQGSKQEGAEAREVPATVIDMGEKVLEGEELLEEENMEEVEEAVEAKEEECDGKTAFGVKLRSTSLSLRVRAKAFAGFKNKGQEPGIQGRRDPSPTKASSIPKKLSTNTPDPPPNLSAVRGSAGWLRGADTEISAQPTLSPLNTEGQTSPDTQKEVRATSVPSVEACQEPPASPQSAPRAAVSWMSMAWGKTRDLQQILTSSLPREFTGIPAPANQQDRAPAQPPTPSLAQIVTQTQRQNAAQTQAANAMFRPTAAQPQHATVQLTDDLLQLKNASQQPTTTTTLTQITGPKISRMATPPSTQTTAQPQPAIELLDTRTEVQTPNTAAPTHITKQAQTSKTPLKQNTAQPPIVARLSTQNTKPSTEASNQTSIQTALPTATQPLEPSTQHSTTGSQPLTPSTQRSTTVSQPLTSSTQRSPTVTELLAQSTQRSPTITQPLSQSTQRSPTITQPLSQSTQCSTTITQPLAPSTQRSPTVTQPLAPSTQSSTAVNQSLAPSTQHSPTVNEPIAQSTQHSPTVTELLAQSTQHSPTITQPLSQSTQRSPTITQPLEQSTQRSPTVTQPLAPSTQRSPTVNEPLTQSTQRSPTITQPLAPSTQHSPTITQPLSKSTQRSPTITQPLAPSTQRSPTVNEPLAQSTQRSSTNTQQLSQSTQRSPTVTQPLVQSTQFSPTVTEPLAQFTQRSVSQITSQFSQRSTQPDLRSNTQTQGQAVPRTATVGATSAPPEPASTLCSSRQCSSPSQPCWSPRLLNHTPHPLPASAPPTTPAPGHGPAPVRGQKNPVLQGRSEGEVGPTEKTLGLDRPGMVGERAAFLEKQMEWSPLPGRRMELRATRTPPEPVASPKTTPTHIATKVAKLDWRPESSPTKMAGSPADREDKWLRRNVPTSTSPSSSPSSSSPLQSVSDTGGQPSWMELAKRKSMAWNDKTMD